MEKNYGATRMNITGKGTITNGNIAASALGDS